MRSTKFSHVGFFSAEPVNCTVMPVFRSHRNDAGCFSSGKINIGRCAGGCGAYTNKCCKAITSRVDVPLTCGDQSDALKKVTLYIIQGILTPGQIPVILC